MKSLERYIENFVDGSSNYKLIYEQDSIDYIEEKITERLREDRVDEDDVDMHIVESIIKEEYLSDDEFIESEKSANDIKKYHALLEIHGENHAKYCFEQIEDVEFYEDMTKEEFVKELLSEEMFGNVPEILINHIDYESLWESTLKHDYTDTEYGVISVR